MAMELIETIEVGAGGAASIEFTSIPQDGKDLLIKFSGRSGGHAIRIDFNNDTTSTSGLRIRLSGDGSSASSATASGNPYVSITQALNETATTSSTFSNCDFYFANYSSVGVKSLSVDTVNENNATTAWQGINAASWGDSSSLGITSLKLYQPNFNLEADSTASLYKIY